MMEIAMKRSKVFLFGDINLDISMPVPEIPPPGQDVYVDKLFINLGGSATNTCVALLQLGLLPRLLGSVGTDPYGDFLLDSLKSHGLETSSVQRKSECPSGQIFLPVLPDGERTMYSFRGANTLTSPQDIPADWFDHADLLHMSGYVFLKPPQRDTALQLIKEAHRNNIPICIDTGLDPVLHAHDEMKSILQYLDVCICGIREGALLTGKEHPDGIVSSFLELGVKCVAIKLGKDGCMVGINNEVFRLPALSVQVQDTTGSGDAFSAGILIARLNQFSLSQMCALANSLGAYIATQVGSLSSRLCWPVLTEFISSQLESQSPEVKQAAGQLLDRLAQDNRSPR
jgi:ribokinase